MNPDASHSVPVDPEARLTALLLGELSPEEAAGLHAEIARRPELAQLLARLARTLPLVREAVRPPAGQAAAPAASPRLSAERRDALLAAFKTVTLPGSGARKAPRRRPTHWLALAAVVTALLIVGAGMLLPSLARAKAKSQKVAAVNAERLLMMEQEHAAAGQETLERGATPARADSRRGREITPSRGETHRPTTPPPAAAPAPDLQMMMRYGLRPSAGRLDPEPQVQSTPLPELAGGMEQAAKPASQPAAPARRGDWYFATTNSRTLGSAADNNLGFVPQAAGAVTTWDVSGRAANLGEPARGYRNDPAGVPTSGTGNGAQHWADYDNDGDLTLFATGQLPTVARSSVHATGGTGGTGGFGGFGGAGGGRGGGGLGGGGAAGDTLALDDLFSAAAPAPANVAPAGPASTRSSRTAGYVLFSDTDPAANAPGTAAPSARAPAPGGGARSLARRDVSTVDAAGEFAKIEPGIVTAAGASVTFGVPVEGAVVSAPAKADKAPAMEELGEAPGVTRSLAMLAARAEEPAPTAAGDFGREQQVQTPVLGDRPVLGKAFGTAVEQKDAGLAEGRGLVAGSSGLVAQPGVAGRAIVTTPEALDLAPLPLQLPIPAFMGTPTDIPLGRAKGVEVEERVPTTPAPVRAVAQPEATQLRSLVALDADGVVRARVRESRFMELADGASTGKPADAVTSLGLERYDDFGALSPETRKERVLEEAGREEPEGLAQQVVSDLEAKSRLAETDHKAVVLSEAAPGVTVPAVPAPTAPPPVPQAEVEARLNPFSTFSLNVADVSFRLAFASLEAGRMPEAASIRVEDFVNAFSYGDPEPAPGVPIGFVWDRMRHPFAHNRELLRFSVKTAAQGREAGRALNLVLLLDNSGSMERSDRVAILGETLRVLAGQLEPADKISVVGFARTARLWVDGLPGSEAGTLPDRVGNLVPEGGTNLEDALKVGYETLARHFVPGGVNRLILLTDGAANLGDVDPQSLQQTVSANRLRGMALDCFGIGWEGYNDDLLQVLTRHGDGRYGFVNTPAEVTTDFAAQLTGALQVAAADVKVQVEFNPRRVTNWRQLGYAKHQLTKEQFRDNTVDAAEIGAAEAGNALYAVEINPRGQGPIGTLRARYRVPATGQYREHEWILDYTGEAVSVESAPPSMRLATVAAVFGEKLSESPWAGGASTAALVSMLTGVPEAFQPDPRPAKLEWMLRTVQSLTGQ